MFTLIVTLIAIAAVAVLPLAYMVPCTMYVGLTNPIESTDGEAWALDLDAELDLDAALQASEEGHAPQPRKRARKARTQAPRLIAGLMPMMGAANDNAKRRRVMTQPLA